jgi:quercetin dioxygenase-like cupin family protein
MIEKQVNYTISQQKVIERIIEDDNVAINHMVLRHSEALPEHFANSNVYMIVARGGVTLRLDAQEPHAYPAGSIVLIPHRTKMNVSNQGNDVLELFVVKAPSPKHIG